VALFGWQWSIGKCRHIALLPQRSKEGKMQFEEAKMGDEAEGRVFIVDPQGLKPQEAIPQQESDVAFRNLGILQDLRGDGGDQMAHVTARTRDAVDTARDHGLSADGAAIVINMVIRSRAIYALKFAACLEEAVNECERQARHYYLQSRGVASTTSRALTETRVEEGGLGYFSWWDELHLEQLTYLLTRIQDPGQAGKLIRAQVWRLQRTTGRAGSPLELRRGEDEEIGHCWVGRLMS